MSIPSGTIIHVAQNSPPSGWLEADGSAVSRTTYGDLFSSIGTTFGSGDGSTTFNLPDLRGEFIRGLDDGRGVDSGRSLGTSQAHALQNMTGSLVGFPHTSSGLTANFAFSRTTSGSTTYASTSSTGGGPNGVTFNASNVARTASETRPSNVALLAVIKI